MQELITYYPELYSLVVEYVGQLSNLLILCRASNQIIMSRKLYNRKITTHIVAYFIRSKRNLRNQLHGKTTIDSVFGKISVIYNENSLVSVSFNDEPIELRDLKQHISKSYPLVKYFNSNELTYHESGAIKRYTFGYIAEFRSDFTICSAHVGSEWRYYYNNNSIKSICCIGECDTIRMEYHPNGIMKRN